MRNMVGCNFAVTGIVVASCCVNGLLPIPAILIGLFVGAALGAFNGFLVNNLKLQPFIAIVIGSLNYDIILNLPRLPERGETLPVLRANNDAGGKGANQAVQAAKLGVNTYMVGSVGDDAMGSYLLKTAQEYGVNIDYINIVSGESGMGIVNAVQSGEVYATIVRGANFQVTKEDIDAVKPLMQKAEIVVFQLEIPINVVTYAIAAAKEAGCKVLLNAAPAEAVPEEYLAMCDIIIVNVTY